MVLDARIHGLPASRTSLVGRDQELATLRAILAGSDAHLLTLTGVGGSGKTRLAFHLARDFATEVGERVWIVELASILESEMVVFAVATSVGLNQDIASAPIVHLSRFLSSQPGLLVLDNCEHLIGACASLADALLDSCPHLRIITTSREPLLIAGERQYRVPPLRVPDPEKLPGFDEIAASSAVTLFVHRAQDVLPSFQLTAINAVKVARICARLGGIPLALELAASQVHVLGLDQILALLDDRFRVLNGSRRITPTRHQTLRAALDWSEALLTDDERRIFRRLSVFAGDFQIEAVEAICSPVGSRSEMVFAALLGLVNKSLVTSESGDGSARYRLLEPVRQYALVHLEESGEAAHVRARYSDVYLAIAERAAFDLHGPNQEASITTLKLEFANLRAALESSHKLGDLSRSLRLTTALAPFWTIAGHLTEGIRWLRQVLDLTAEGVDSALRIRALQGAGRMLFLHEDADGRCYREAESLHRESLALAELIDDRFGVAAAWTELGMVWRIERDLERSSQALTRSLEMFRELDDAHGIAMAMLNLGSTVGYLGDASRAVDLISASRERFRMLGDFHSVAIAEVLLGRLALLHGDFEPAIEFIIDALATHARLGDPWFQAFDLLALAEAFAAQKRDREVVRLVAAAEALRQPLGHFVGRVTFKDLFARIDLFRKYDWFEAVWAEGHAFELDDAVKMAASALNALSSPRQLSTAIQPTTKLLTRRERQVAVLLSTGYTDRQIADELFVSVGTVSNHVHHILHKLQLGSRLQVASWLAAQEQFSVPIGL